MALVPANLKIKLRSPKAKDGNKKTIMSNLLNRIRDRVAEDNINTSPDSSSTDN